MKATLFIAVAASSVVLAAPVPLAIRMRGRALLQRQSACPAFALQDYNTFQISDGTGGTAQAEANAVFVDPFAGCDLSTVDSTSLDNLNTMARAAVDAEETFNAAVDAGGDSAEALDVGKSKNKVLKLTGEVQVLLIQAAQGEDTAEKLAEEQAKLDENLSIDAENAGAAALSIQFGSSTSTDTSDDSTDSNYYSADTADVAEESTDDSAYYGESTDDSEESTDDVAVDTTSTAGGAACPAFALQDYNTFQISDGTGGTAQAEANAVFVDPFAGCDLSTVDSTSLDNLNTMARAAVDAEETFNAAVDAGGDAAEALDVGKSKNKVLKLTGEVQVLLIQAAQGEDTAEKLAEEQAKLDENLSIDAENAGAAALSIQFDG